MQDWVLITIFAAMMQTVRTGLQKSLKTHLSAEAITWVRYGFGFPIALAYIVFLNITGLEIPTINSLFITYCLLAGIAQIFATILLVSLFSHRNFAVGTAYTKTEAILTALIGALLFGEYISTGSTIAIILGVIGVVIISVIEEKAGWKSILTGLTKKPALLGIGSGGAFAMSALLIREASLALEHERAAMSAALTLITMILMQTFILGFWMTYKNRRTFLDIKHYWKPSALVGLTSILGSIGWFTALAMTQAAHVKAVGQIELIFSILITHNVFKEHINRLELLGIAMVSTSILLLLYFVG